MVNGVGVGGVVREHLTPQPLRIVDVAALRCRDCRYDYRPRSTLRLRFVSAEIQLTVNTPLPSRLHPSVDLASVAHHLGADVAVPLVQANSASLLVRIRSTTQALDKAMGEQPMSDFRAL